MTASSHPAGYLDSVHAALIERLMNRRRLGRPLSGIRRRGDRYALSTTPHNYIPRFNRAELELPPPFVYGRLTLGQKHRATLFNPSPLSVSLSLSLSRCAWPQRLARRFLTKSKRCPPL